MYNRRYRKCCQQKNYDSNIIESVCNNYGVTADYYYKKNDNSCDCGFEQEDSVFPQNPVLAQSYVPIQYMDKTFKPSVGLKMGTIFPELVSPYFPGQSMEEINFIEKTNEIGKGCNKCC